MVLGLFEARDRGCSNYAACMSHPSCRGRLGSVFIMRRQLPRWLDVIDMMRRRRPSNRSMHQYPDCAASPGPRQLLLSDAKPDMMISRFPGASNASWSAHVIATALNRGKCNANAHYVHVRRSSVLGNPGRRAQIVFPWLKSLGLPELFVL